MSKSEPAGQRPSAVDSSEILQDPIRAELLQALVRSLRKLGEAGHPDEASRIAAKVYSALRHDDPASAERINGTMHYLARLPDSVNAPQNHAKTQDSGHAAN
ncbi:MAG: hypothetical protein KF742_08540 [Cryobacterium sp.]|nr:hypothetical protein [Cryobacterium sp.]MBX3089280.1 hypothetical protein [Cryobacterium sp.]MCO5294544.1 hypothetical protein [Homoserinimonas sp.]MCW5944592.1 hypothetical protein [Cryobacterium sp.]